ncbi:hypothetical protein OIU79_012761 [Salix purpurea]|uniref:Uncharacterized protein n=1 Tax=Salix purpurea TaxID=77065 RepID=A0A9Q0Q4D4_SALPP|nr:hypothetical protein OIU79_012761 [Salix purpurea]
MQIVQAYCNKNHGYRSIYFKYSKLHFIKKLKSSSKNLNLLFHAYNHILLNRLPINEIIEI